MEFLIGYSIFVTLALFLVGLNLYKEDQEKKSGTKKEKILKASEVEAAKLQNEKDYILANSIAHYKNFVKNYIEREESSYFLNNNSYSSERKLVNLLRKSSEYCEIYFDIYRSNGWFVKIDMNENHGDVYIKVKNHPFEQQDEISDDKI